MFTCFVWRDDLQGTIRDRMDLTLVCWNTRNRSLNSEILAIWRSTKFNVLVLIESGQNASDFQNAFTASTQESFRSIKGSSARFLVFSNVGGFDLVEKYSSTRLSIRRLCFDGLDFNLGLVHGLDKRNFDSHHQASQVIRLSAEIRDEEARWGHDRTILVGDFNLNPFDFAMTLPDGLNAVMSKACLRKGYRRVNGVDYPFFYNPRWSLFGDQTPGPAGTYYYQSSTDGLYGWNMLDQAVLRQSVLPWFDSVSILTNADGTEFVTKLHFRQKSVTHASMSKNCS